ncbi:IclR family transcriptional regulator [Roseisalinus antarcticus]|uniref:Pectin degradation repressor protein KdgR n=1 Tax=Roseisalinus antarcticus TaxID=254357 RepID=A0A1Y5TWG9_9RHOB|nr:IclR family transcriptional regulator [Roseisalinus antarcticus]SLN75382.1 Pectin degradation repressor protein KdgR [Roseisalinus antarcticus]
MTTYDAGTRSVKSAERILDLLEYIGGQPNGVTFKVLSKDLHIPKSSLHGLLDVLVTRGYAELRPISRTYVLGLRSWETGQAYQRNHSMVREARAVLESIVAKVNETAQLATLVGTENVYLAKVDSTHPLRLISDVGRRLSAHATGVGKALLAHLPDAEVKARFGTGALECYTANTMPTVDALIEELAISRVRGFAIDNEEYTPGVFCLSVPVFDGDGAASSAMSVSVPTSRADQVGMVDILSQLCAASLALSRRCGVTTVDRMLAELTQQEMAKAAIDLLIGSGRYVLHWSGRP